jgi:hypothetical protein
MLQLNGMVPFAVLWKGVKAVSLKTLAYVCNDVGTISLKPFDFEFLVNASTRCPDTVLQAWTKW